METLVLIAVGLFLIAVTAIVVHLISKRSCQAQRDAAVKEQQREHTVWDLFPFCNLHD